MVKTVALVSLSRGLIGEDFIAHEYALGVRRLEEMGLKVKLMPNAGKGLSYLAEHPEKRAEDLLEAFADEEVDMILCAIGGDDTYRLLPYLFDDNALQKVLKNKIFLGFSDTSVNHLMLHKLGLPTFYGQSFLADICELDKDMLPYSRACFEELVRTGGIREIRPSKLWYEERSDFGPAAIGTARKAHPNQGFVLLQGAARFSGEILGGCIESLYYILPCENPRYADEASLCEKYKLFPPAGEWRGKILLLESSEEKTEPALYRKMLECLKERGIFAQVEGVLVGKPMDECYDEEYKKILVEVIDDAALPIVCNINVGHATPRCIVPFGKKAKVDAAEQVIRFI